MAQPQVKSNFFARRGFSMILHKKNFCNRLDINFALFILLTLNFPKWPWVNILTHPQVLSYLCLKYELSMFLQKIDFDWPRILHFSFLWPWICKKMTKAQDQDIFISHIHSLYQTVASFSITKYGLDRNMHFLK